MFGPLPLISVVVPAKAYLVDVLALELRDELVEALVIGLDTDGVEDLLDVAGRRGGVATEPEKEIRSQVLHGDGLWRRAVRIDCGCASRLLLANCWTHNW